MRIKPTDDLDGVGEILAHPFVASALAYDGHVAEPIDHPLVRYWLVCDGEAVVGIFMAFQQTRWEVEVHTAFLPNGIRLSRSAGLAWLEILFSEPELQRATAYVLGSRPSAANYCRKLGFVDEGRRRNAVKIEGVATDIVLLGLTREGWASYRQLQGPECAAQDRSRAAPDLRIAPARG